MEHFLYDLVVVFGLSVVVLLVFSKLRLPPLVGFILTGIVVGPQGLALVREPAYVDLLAEVGIVVLLFAIGVELSLKRVIHLWRMVLFGGASQVAVTAALAGGAAFALGHPPGPALLIGFIVALSSTAIVMRVLSERDESTAPHGQVSLGMLFFQDLIVVPMILVVPFLGASDAGWVSIATTLLKAGLLVIVVLLVARRVVPPLLHQVIGTRSPELFLLTLLVVCLGTAWFTAEIGLTFGLGAFLAGLIISESEYSHNALGAILPFRDAFSSLFFVSIGMLLDVGYVMGHLPDIAAATGAIILGKALLVTAVVLLLGYHVRIAVLAGMLLAQVGEFSFLLVHAGIQANVLQAETHHLLIAATVTTMSLTPFVALVAPRISRWSARFSRKPEEPEPVAAERDHVIIVGYGVNGQNVARTLKRAEMPYLILELNPETVRRVARAGEPIRYGDAMHLETLKHVGIGRARVLVITIPDAASTRRIVKVVHDLYPGVHMIVRTRLVREVGELYRLGADEVVPEEFETSIEIFSRVLRCYMVPHELSDRLTREIREEGYEMLRTLQSTYRPIEGLRRLLADVEFEAFGVWDRSPIRDQTLAEARIKQTTGALVLAVHRDNVTTPNPPADWRLEVHDVALLLGTPEALTRAGQLFREV